MLRKLDRSDRDAIRRIWNEVAPFDQLSEQLVDEKIWGDSDYDPELQLMAVDDAGDPTGFVSGVIRQKDDQRIGYIKLMSVGVRHQRGGHGSELLDEIERRLAERGADVIRVGESAPNYLVPGVDARYTKAVVFFEEKGYERFGQTYNMVAELTDQTFDTRLDEERLRASGFEVRRATDVDREAVMILLEEHWPSWRGEIDVTFDNRPISLHIATMGDRVVAFSAYDSNNLGTGWFGPMGSEPAVRGLGIGGVLLKRCLADIKSQGLHQSIIPWVGPIGFYLHYAGAEVSRVFFRLEKKVMS